ncbi:MAG: hypothetical protein WDO14_10935 [Bacteroidota bacterium]
MRPWLITCFILLLVVNGFSQQKKKPPVKATPKPSPVEGFWLVTKVTIGARELTPVARWFKLDANGKQVSGNGWTQHSFGTYKFDKTKSELSFVTTNEPEDEYGAFKVAKAGPLMTWSRKEENELVVVELKPITELPMSPSDAAKGLWVLNSAVNRDVDVTKSFDPDHKHFLFIRWDRQYVKQINAHERISGYWFFDALRPEITFISENREQGDETWTVTIEGQKMILTMKDMTLTYSRATEFPK